MEDSGRLLAGITPQSSQAYVNGLVHSQWRGYKESEISIDPDKRLRSKAFLETIDAILDKCFEFKIYKAGIITEDRKVMADIGTVAFFDSVTNDIDNINTAEYRGIVGSRTEA
jgi:hypothetical protein